MSQHANALARKFAKSANTLANAKSGVPAGPSKSPGQFTLLPFQAPVSAQRMIKLLRKRAVSPFHSIRPSCPGHLLQQGQLPLLKDHRREKQGSRVGL